MDYNNKIKQKREEILKERQNFEKEKESWEALFIEEKNRLEKEIELLQRYKKNQIDKKIKLNEEQKLSNLKDEYECKDIKSEIENLKSLYNLKLSKITNEKKLLEEEKAKFEKFKTDMNNNLEIKKIDIEQKNLDLLKQNSEINKRYNDIRNKEAYLNDKYEDYQRIKNFVEMKEKQNYQYEKDLKLAAIRIQDNIKEINMKENLIEQQKTDLLKKNNILIEQQKKIENDRLDIEQEKTELNLRYQYFNSFSYKMPNINYDAKNNMDIKLANDNNSLKDDDKMNFNMNNEYIGYGINGQGYNTYNYINGNMNNYNNNYEKFNADKYINAVKNRIENGKKIYYQNYNPNDDKFDISKEREYIRKSKTLLDRNNKNV